MQKYRIGFCCKWLDHADQVNGLNPKDAAKQFNTGATTVRWLNENRSQAEDKLWQLIQQNLTSVRLLVERVSTFNSNLRMMRISSDVLPMYTEPTYRYLYQRQDIRDYCAKEFARIGAIARENDVRLSFHPGQFCVLASANESIVERSIDEFEYHVDMARWMGYGSTWHDYGFKINVHISGAHGAEGIINVLLRLSQEARNLITIENEEMKWGLEETLKLANHLAIVLDVHHHWVKTSEYIQANDDRVKIIIDSWRGVRPAMHYSAPKQEIIPQAMRDCDQLPDLEKLLIAGVKRAHLRAHSDFYWNNAMNVWVKSFLNNFDIQAEAKAKNLASQKLLEQLNQIPE